MKRTRTGSGPRTAGDSYVVFANADTVVGFDLMIGKSLLGSHRTEVERMRRDNDHVWIGSNTSAFDQ